MKLEKIELPKKYEYIEGGSNPLYKKYDGWNKISYSQKNSFKDYRLGYLQDYILKVGSGESGIFALMGTFCGEFFENGTRNDHLTDFDVETISKIKKYPTSKCEAEIVINLEPFGLKQTVLQGFSDHEYENDCLLFIEDLKTGNSKKMNEKYGDMDKYFQTRIYAYQREIEGFEIGGCRVIHLGRKGNNLIKGDKNVLRLTGEIDYIETPYKKEDVEKYLKETVVSICKDISNYYKIYNKYFVD